MPIAAELPTGSVLHSGNKTDLQFYNKNINLYMQNLKGTIQQFTIAKCKILNWNYSNVLFLIADAVAVYPDSWLIWWSYQPNPVCHHHLSAKYSTFNTPPQSNAANDYSNSTKILYYHGFCLEANQTEYFDDFESPCFRPSSAGPSLTDRTEHSTLQALLTLFSLYTCMGLIH